VTAHKRKPLKQWADIELKTTATSVITSVTPRRWQQPRRQCNTTAGRNRGGLQGSGRIGRQAEPPGRRDASQWGAVACQPVMSSSVPARERIVVVRYKQTEPGEGGRKDRE